MMFSVQQRHMERRDRHRGAVAALVWRRRRQCDGGLLRGQDVGGVGPLGAEEVLGEKQREAPHRAAQVVQDLHALPGDGLGPCLLQRPGPPGEEPCRAVHGGGHEEEAGDV